jgi:hypothetical protein
MHETRTGQQVAQLLDSYVVMMMMMTVGNSDYIAGVTTTWLVRHMRLTRVTGEARARYL